MLSLKQKYIVNSYNYFSEMVLLKINAISCKKIKDELHLLRVISETRSTSHTSLTKQFYEAAIVGGLRGLVGLPVEQPLDRIKTSWQASPTVSSIGAMMKKIYIDEGLAGFYKGGIPNGFRLASKQSYRFPIMLMVPNIYEKKVSEDFQHRHPKGATIVTVVALAKVETFFITPFERIKVWLMTNPHQKNRIRDFFAQNQGKMIQTVYQGWRPTFMKVTANYFSFLFVMEKCKDFARRKTNEKEIPFALLLLFSFPIATANTIAVVPFDVAKTSLQKAGTTQYSTWRVVHDLVKRHGISFLFRGWQIKFTHSLLQAAFTVPLLEKVQQLWKKRN